MPKQFYYELVVYKNEINPFRYDKYKIPKRNNYFLNNKDLKITDLADS